MNIRGASLDSSWHKKAESGHQHKFERFFWGLFGKTVQIMF
jgi:hypothetical protein